MPIRRTVPLLAACLLLAACATVARAATAPAPSADPVSPTGLVLTATPATAAAGGQVTLKVTGIAKGAKATTGIDAALERWDGKRWVPTHRLLAAVGRTPARVASWEQTVFVPAVALDAAKKLTVPLPVGVAGLHRVAKVVTLTPKGGTAGTKTTVYARVVVTE